MANDKSMNSDPQTRKWLVTINNPSDHDMSHDVIKGILNELKGLVYACVSDEVGAEGTYHTHIFLCFGSARRFTTIKKLFPSAHLDFCRGTSQDNRDYVFKEGKWVGNEKEGTNLPDTHFEIGELPIERPGKRNDLEDLYDMIKSGMSNHDIISENPLFMLQIDRIDKVRQTLLEEKYRSSWRELDVTYVYGPTGCGKSRFVMDSFGYTNVYRVTDYRHPFDSYKNQDVVLFEEFRSSLCLSEMLTYLDGYPLDLPSRYSNKVACFTKVFICTNISLSQQFPHIQREEPESYQAFLRRINHVMKFSAKNIYVKYTLDDYLSRWESSPVHPFRSAN